MSMTEARHTSDSIASAGIIAYRAKGGAYFSGARPDILADLPGNRDAAILEIGCGHGATGALALAEGRCGTYCGVELFDDAAGIAAGHLTEVVTGDVEKIALPWPAQTFDVLILSEVLEHLVDPWAALARLRPLLKPGAKVFASSPNAAHYAIILMLVAGEWRLENAGPMDRTHLRWFTPRSYRRLFEGAGFIVDRVEALSPPGWKAKIFLGLTLGRSSHLVARQIMLRGHLG
jgi:2-polyprenyl-3-methyl-5-hydroxy-6-metoxy-1,4-benzoquinol methylase